ncbi:MAG: NUDIX domain-containing protein [Alistipes sp.]|nr:NUDIX domain-containing protein [Alistipes sp.]
MPTVFYGDSVLVFSAADRGTPPGFTAVSCDGNFAKMIENLEKYKQVIVPCCEPARAFEAFAAGFRAVDAAGGLVENPRGELLMIRRNGRWDLPKGHREEGESFAGAALREVLEETGVAARLESEVPCETTMHFYPAGGLWEMKTTRWFAMRSEQASTSPQREEGIESVHWVAGERVAQYAVECFPSVRQVLRAAGWIQGAG